MNRCAKMQNLDMLVLPDCSYLTEKGECKLLSTYQCTGKKCSFKHTIDDETTSVLRWKNRLLSLSDEQQTKISNKYYGGLMPWK